MIYWMPIVTPLSPNPATNSTPSGKVTQFDGTIKAITLMQDSSTLYVAEKSTNFSAINVWKLDVRSNELIPSSSRTLVFSVNATQWPFISTSGSNTVSGLAVHPQNSIVYLSFTDKVRQEAKTHSRILLWQWILKRMCLSILKSNIPSCHQPPF